MNKKRGMAWENQIESEYSWKSLSEMWMLLQVPGRRRPQELPNGRSVLCTCEKLEKPNVVFQEVPTSLTSWLQ